VGATIGGSLECDEGEFVSIGKGLALDVNGAEIKNSILLRKIVAAGEFDFSYAQVHQDFQWRDVKSSERAVLNLQFSFS